MGEGDSWGPGLAFLRELQKVLKYEAVSRVKLSSRGSVQRWAEALRQNPEYSVRIEVPSQKVFRAALRLLEKAGVQDAPITVVVKK